MNTDILNINLSALKQFRPDLLEKITPYFSQPFPGKIQPSKNGQPNIVYPVANDKFIFIHHPDDPAIGSAEFVKLAESKEGQYIFFFGFGLGYEVLEICKALSHLNRIVVIDNNPLFFVQALLHIDLTEMIKNTNVFLHIGIGIDDLDPIIALLDRWFLLHQLPYLLVHQTIASLDQPFFTKARNRIYRLINAQYMQSFGTITAAKDLMANAFANLSSLVKASPLSSLKNRYQGLPAILVAAGPSLKKNLHLLKGHEDKAVIFCVDTAVPNMIQQSIQPDFILAMDHHHRNADYFWGYWDKLPQSALIYHNLTTPYIPKLFQGKSQFYVFDKSRISELFFNKMLGSTPPLPNIFSVGLLSFVAAQTLGCDPIILIGLDLSFEGEYDQQKIDQADMIQVPGSIKPFVYTNHVFLSTIQRFNEQTSLSDKTVIDATEGGALIQNTRVEPLSQCLLKYCNNVIPKPELNLFGQTKETCERCIRFMNETQKRFFKLKKECQDIYDAASFALTDLQNRYHQVRQNNQYQFQVSDELAEAYNRSTKKITAIAGDSAAGDLSDVASLLDTILGQTRLTAHREILSWKKQMLQPGSIPQILNLISNMHSHQIQSSGMLESIDWICNKIDIAVQRMAHIINTRPLDDYMQDHTDDQDNLDRLINMGNIMIESMDLYEALSLFESLENRYPANPEINLSMGKIWLGLREPAKAIDNFEKAVELEPEYKRIIDKIIAKASLEYIEAARDRIKRNRKGAEKYLQDILPGFPDYPEAQRLMTELKKNDRTPL